jgi:hypothetical protein
MRRRRVALSLAILWIVGFELMPWAHIALHDHLAHNHHDENGADVLDEKHDDDRDAAVDEHGVPVALGGEPDEDEDAPLNDGEQRLLDALAHGAHSFAHHGIAVPVPAPVMTAPLPVDRRPITIEIAEAPAWVSAAVPEASARGPPASLV